MRQHMRCTTTGAVLTALALMVPPGAGTAHGGKLKIVTTTTDLASIARRVAGDLATVQSICTGREDPHFVQAKPSYVLRASHADLWIRIGMELEIGWEPPILRGARNPAILEGGAGHLDASERVVRLDVPTRRVTRAQGDVHPQGNPHYWLDPLNGRLIATSMAERLASLDPGHAAEYRRNLAAFHQALDHKMFGRDLVAAVGGEKLWVLALRKQLGAHLAKHGLGPKAGGWYAALRPHRGARIVTYHRSWVYLANRFGLTVAVEVEPKPGIPPRPAHLARVVEAVQSQGIRLILVEPFYPRKAADFVAARTGAKTVVCANTAGGTTEAGGYLDMIDRAVGCIASTLGE